MGHPHISSGAITSGQIGVTAGTPDGTKFLRDDYTWAAAGGGLASGNVGSGYLASGSVQGFFSPTRDIASGTVGVFDFGSGAVIAGTVGSGAIQSGNIASGQVGPNALASGIITSGFLIGSGAIYGQVAGGIFIIASGSLGYNELSSGSVKGQAAGGPPRHILSGTVGAFDLGSGQVVGGVGVGISARSHIASGTLDLTNIASGYFARDVAPIQSGGINTILTGERVSGVRAVYINSSGIVMIAKSALSGSMPAVGVIYDNVLSGVNCSIHTNGFLQIPTTGANYSGYGGRLVYVGVSGEVVQWSGSFGSGGFFSGMLSQVLGVVANSGGVMLNVSPLAFSGFPGMFVPAGMA